MGYFSKNYGPTYINEVMGIALWWSDDHVIERFRVRVPEGAAGKCSSPGSAICAYSYFCHFGHSAKSASGRLQLNTHAFYVCDFE